MLLCFKRHLVGETAQDPREQQRRPWQSVAAPVPGRGSALCHCCSPVGLTLEPKHRSASAAVLRCCCAARFGAPCPLQPPAQGTFSDINSFPLPFPRSESSLSRFAHRLSVKQKQEKRRKAEYGSAELSAFRPRSLSIEW